MSRASRHITFHFSGSHPLGDSCFEYNRDSDPTDVSGVHVQLDAFLGPDYLLPSLTENSVPQPFEFFIAQGCGKSQVDVTGAPVRPNVADDRERANKRQPPSGRVKS